MKKLLIVLVLVSILSSPFVVKAQELDINQPIQIQSEEQLVQLKIALMKQLINLLQQLIELMKNQQTIEQPITIIQEPEVIIQQPIVSAITEPLTFIQTPKLVFREGRLARIVWQTNKPTTLVISPVFPDGDGWTTSGSAWESCGRQSVSIEINSTCRIVVKDVDGNQIEYSLKVFEDQITE